MLKIMIVDDEVPIRQWFNYCINNSNKGYLIVGEAENGRDALDLFNRELPDVVFTDIKMPVMDGLALVREIKRIRAETDIIILTAYSDFEMAKRAIDFHVSKYILKSEARDTDIIDILNEISNSRLAQSTIMKADSNRSQLLKDAVLSKLLEKNIIDYAQIKELIANSGIQINENNIFSIAVRYYQEEKTGNLKISEGGIIDGIAENMCVFRIDDRKYLFLGNIKNQHSKTMLHKKLHQLAELIFDTFNCSVGVSNLYHDFLSLQQACHEALKALDQDFFKGGKCISFFSELNKDESGAEKIEKKMRNYIISVHNMDMLSILNNANDILNCYADGSIGDIEYIRKTCLQMVSIILDKVKSEDVLKKIIPLNCDPDYESVIKSMSCFKELKTWVNNEVKLLSENIFCNFTQELVISKVKEYVESNFSEPLSLKDVAEYVHLNADYFCRLFKNKTGQNFSVFLLRYRLDKAEQLLQNSDRKVSEIAEMVGYPNASCFSRVFKKHIGKKASNSRNPSI